jgi:hypothetical protein
MKQYRALISVPISAKSDEDAVRQGVDYAHSLCHPGSEVIAGHLELVGEVREGLLGVLRVVDAEPQLLKQLPPDWRP